MITYENIIPKVSIQERVIKGMLCYNPKKVWYPTTIESMFEIGYITPF